MILKQILQSKKAEIAQLPNLKWEDCTPSDRDFLAAIKAKSFAVIGEIKSKSPSEGIICEAFHPDEIAKRYESAGVAALSVLTDHTYFNGSFEALQQAREACSLPALCKEFIIDEKQILQARKYGADAILLIVRILSDEQLAQFKHLAERLKMAVLIEVFDEQDCERALAVQPQLIGINNRNLDTLEMDTDNASRLKPLFSKDLCILSLSGVKSPNDVIKLKNSFNGALIGTALMRSDKPSLYIQ